MVVGWALPTVVEAPNSGEPNTQAAPPSFQVDRPWLCRDARDLRSVVIADHRGGWTAIATCPCHTSELAGSREHASPKRPPDTKFISVQHANAM